MKVIVEKTIPWGSPIDLGLISQHDFKGRFAFNNCQTVRSGPEAGHHVTYMDSAGEIAVERIFPFAPRPEPEPVAEAEPETEKPKRETSKSKKKAEKPKGEKRGLFGKRKKK